MGHLDLQQLLHHPLDDLTQEAGIVQQDLLHQLRVGFISSGSLVINEVVLVCGAKCP
jgi:hypothetical protein